MIPIARLRCIVWQGLAWSCIGLATAGIVLPLLPTTPFLLVAAWAATKGSPRLADWLACHPRLGPPLHAWRTHCALPRRAKRLAIALLATSWTGLWVMGLPALALALIAALFISIATYLVTRPDAGYPGTPDKRTPPQPPRAPSAQEPPCI